MSQDLLNKQRTAVLAMEISQFAQTKKQLDQARYIQLRGQHFANIVRLNGAETMLLINNLDKRVTGDVLNHMAGVVDSSSFDIVEMAQNYIDTLAKNPLDKAATIDLQEQVSTKLPSETPITIRPDFISNKRISEGGFPQATLGDGIIEVIQMTLGASENIDGLPTVEEATMADFLRAQQEQRERIYRETAPAIPAISAAPETSGPGQ